MLVNICEACQRGQGSLTSREEFVLTVKKRIAEGPPSTDVTGPFRFYGLGNGRRVQSFQFLDVSATIGNVPTPGRCEFIPVSPATTVVFIAGIDYD